MKELVSCVESFLLLHEVGFPCDRAWPSHMSAVPSKIHNPLEILALLVWWVEIILQQNHWSTGQGHLTPLSWAIYSLISFMIKARAYNFSTISSITNWGLERNGERKLVKKRLSYGMRLSSLGDHVLYVKKWNHFSYMFTHIRGTISPFGLCSYFHSSP